MERFSDTRVLLLLCLNAALYVLIVIFDAMNAAGGLSPALWLACDAFKYAAIISCFLICVFAYSRSHDRHPRIQIIVFCFTLVADLLLLFTPYFAIGVLFFIGAHTSALIRYKPRWAPAVGICAAAVFVLVMFFAPRVMHTNAATTLVIGACAAYAIIIINVTVSTFFAEQPRVNTIFSRLGMLLFVACDINVAIFNATPEGYPAHTASIVLMWFFYLPAQTLLALSTCDWRKASEGSPENSSAGPL